MQAPQRDSDSSSPPPRLGTLGGFRLVSAPLHPAEPLLGPGKPLALLLYLHSAPARSASRDHLTDLLWADLDPTAARHALRQTLWYLRRRIGPECLHTDNGDVVLRLALACDRDEFVRLVGDGRLEEAVAVYAGHFLPDFAVPGGLEFEHWADAERSRLRLMFLRAAESVVRVRLSTGHTREACALALRARDGSPHSEATWRLYLETLVAGHDTVGAVAEAERMLAMLRHDGRTPEPATRALLRTIQNEPQRTSDVAAGLMAELVGREREFATIVEAWDGVATGRTAQVHVSAPAGLGKTRLLLDVEARLTAGGGRCVYARANPGEQAVPFALAAEVAERLVGLPGAKGISTSSAGVLVALNPALSSTFGQSADTAVGEEAARRRSLAMTELVRVLADEAPLAIFVDDLHWADLASRRLLDVVFERVTGKPVLIVTAARPLPGTELPSRVVGVELPPLTREQTGALLASLGELPDDLADAFPQLLAGASHGSPLLALESLQAAMDVGILHLTDGRWHTPDLEALARRFTLGSALRDRLARLDRTERGLILLLATGGLPLSAATLAAAAGRPADGVAAALLELERLGLVQRSLDGWEPLHDAIAEAAVSEASDEARTAASVALGRALARQGDPHTTAIARAAQLLAGTDDAALAELFRQWVRERRRSGDRRSASILASDGLGLHDGTVVDRLTRSLSVSDRIGVPRSLTAAAVVLLLVGAFLLGTVARAGPGPDIRLIVAAPDASGRPAAFELDLRAADWRPSLSIEATDGRAVPRLADAASWYSSAGSPDGRRWARSVISDSGAVDVVLRAPNGEETWLTSGPADDNFEDWSPDGRFVLISTGRWHERSMYDLATVDVMTRAVTRLTSGDGHDLSARWSPDGTRIVFVRRHPLTGMPNQLCWVGVDGSSEQCRDADPPQVIGAAWVSPGEVNVTYVDGGEQAVLHIDVDHGTTRAIDLRGADVRLSPDGRWALCRCIPPGARRLGWYAVPLARPDDLRPITWAGSPDVPFRSYWLDDVRHAAVLDHLSVDSFPGTVTIGAVVRPTVRGYDAAGGVVHTPIINWSVSDTTLAVVRPDGALVARAPGAVTVTASAGGWRTASTTIRIDADTARTVFLESWADTALTAWHGYGEPRPVTRSTATGAALLVNGDGSHSSGAYTRHTFDPVDGLGIELAVRTPVTAPQWQHLGVQLVSPASDTGTNAWEHRTRRPAALDAPTRTCGAGTGSTGIQQGVLHLFLAAGGTQRLIPLPWTPLDDRWYRLRIQLLPDGRCGFALDGVPVWVSLAHLPMDGPFRIDLTGQTVGSDLLVGELEAWEGVRMDVDWSEERGIEGSGVGGSGIGGSGAMIDQRPALRR